MRGIARKGPADDLDACRSALATMERIARSQPGDAGIQSDLANRHAWMADALRLGGRDREALAHREKQAAIIDALLAKDPKNASYRQDWMLGRFSMAALLRALGQHMRADAMIAESRRVVDDLIASDPQNRDWRVWRQEFTRNKAS